MIDNQESFLAHFLSRHPLVALHHHLERLASLDTGGIGIPSNEPLCCPHPYLGVLSKNGDRLSPSVLMLDTLDSGTYSAECEAPPSP